MSSLALRGYFSRRGTTLVTLFWLCKWVEPSLQGCFFLDPSVSDLKLTREGLPREEGLYERLTLSSSPSPWGSNTDLAGYGMRVKMKAGYGMTRLEMAGCGIKIFRQERDLFTLTDGIQDWTEWKTENRTLQTLPGNCDFNQAGSR